MRFFITARGQLIRVQLGPQLCRGTALRLNSFLRPYHWSALGELLPAVAHGGPGDPVDLAIDPLPAGAGLVAAHVAGDERKLKRRYHLADHRDGGDI
jgi:hypothetical protein